jgi:hypothetical protein
MRKSGPAGTNKQRERAHLAEADRHLTNGKRRVARQQRLVAELKADGHSTAKAQQLLRTMQESLAQYEIHRQAIVDKLTK